MVKRTDFIAKAAHRFFVLHSIGKRYNAEKKGERRGETRGETLGKIKGKAEMLIELLEDEFSKVDQRTQMLIYELDEASLRDCFKRLKFAQSVDEVVGHLY